MAGQRIKGLVAMAAAGLLLAGCANKASADGAASSAPVVAALANAYPDLISNNRLIAGATYADEPTNYLPPPASAKMSMSTADAVALYSKGNLSPEKLGDFDYTLAQLASSSIADTKTGQLVWLIINHHQHEISSGPADMDPKLRASLQAADQDTVTVIDAVTGQWIVQQQMSTFHKGTIGPVVGPAANGK